MMKKLALYILGAQMTFSAAFVPQVFFVDLDRPGTEEVTVINNSSSPIRYSVTIAPEDGEYWEGYELEGEWVRFYPRVVSVGPMSRGVIRFRVNPPKELAEGEYRGNIFLQEMAVRPENNGAADDGSESSIAMGIQNDFMLAIYAHKGEKDYSAEIEGAKKVFEENSARFEMSLKNRGNITMRPKVEVSYLDSRERIVEKNNIFLEIAPPNSERNYSRILSAEASEIPEGTAKIRYEVYHFDLNSQENKVKLYESEQAL